MSSPFPGMDPYLENPRRWPGFHNDLAAEINAALNQVLDPRYVSSLTSSVAYEAVEIAPRRMIQPDVAVLRTATPADTSSTAVATRTAAPVESAIPWEIPLMLYRVEILTTEEEMLVTAIEILSPANKRPGGETTLEYRRKRRDMFRSSAHLVEIDLLRAGERPPLEEAVPIAPYYVTLSRAERRPIVEVWPIQLSERLPTIPVPVLEPDPDVPLDLAAAVASVYERGAYARKIDYRQPPPAPPLSAEEAAWMDALLRDKSLRGDPAGDQP